MKAFRFNPDWYRVKYSLAALHANRAAALGAVPQPTGAPASASELTPDSERRAARQHADTLMRRALATLEELDAPLRTGGQSQWSALRALSRPERRGLRDFLETTMLPPAIVLLAGMEDQADDDGAQVPSSYAELRTAVQKERPLPARSLASFVSGLPDRDPRTDYNLACLHTGWGEYSRAAELLLDAVRRTPEQQRARLIDRATGDPTLSVLFARNEGQSLKQSLGEMRNELTARLGANASATSP